jgi:hypothetical protein
LVAVLTDKKRSSHSGARLLREVAAQRLLVSATAGFEINKEKK